MSKNQQFSEAYPEAAIREGSDELTLRADEVGTLWAFINKDHIKFERGEPPLVDADWRAFCQATCTGFDEEDWEELHCHTTDMSKATGAKKPSESEKAKGLWAMKAAKDRGEVYYDPARKDNILERNIDTSEVVGRAPQRPDRGTGQSSEVCGEPLLRLAVGSKLQWLAVVCVPRFCKRCGKGPFGKASGLAWTHGTVCTCSQRPPIGTSRGSMGRMAFSS